MPAFCREASNSARRGPFSSAIQLRQRVFVGKQSDKTATVILADAKSRPRLRLVVDSAGAARIEFLDDDGKIVRTLSAASDH